VKAPHLQQGRQAEDLALSYLKRQGLRLIKRNYRSRRGEIDLIMEQGDTLVLVEVRYRKSAAFGDALESVSVRKQARIIACAGQYLSETECDQPVRFDVIAISPQPVSLQSGELSIQWVRDAFQT